MHADACANAALLDDWQVVRAVAELATGRVMTTWHGALRTARPTLKRAQDLGNTPAPGPPLPVRLCLVLRVAFHLLAESKHHSPLFCTYNLVRLL